MPDSRNLTRYLVAFIVAIHGLIHVMGFVTTWELAEIDQLEGSTLFSLDPGTSAGRAFGLVWLAAALLLLGTTVGLVVGARWTSTVAGIAAAVSLLVTVVWWTDAWI